METLLRRLALAVGLACGLLGTQAPEFGQQYRQRLAGAVDELSRVVATFDAEAHDEGISPDKAIERLETNGDTLARERGRDMTDDKARLNRLKDALADFAEGRRSSGCWRFSRATIPRSPAAPGAISRRPCRRRSKRSSSA